MVAHWHALEEAGWVKKCCTINCNHLKTLFLLQNPQIWHTGPLNKHWAKQSGVDNLVVLWINKGNLNCVEIKLPRTSMLYVARLCLADEKLNFNCRRCDSHRHARSRMDFFEIDLCSCWRAVAAPTTLLLPCQDVHSCWRAELSTSLTGSSLSSACRWN